MPCRLRRSSSLTPHPMASSSRPPQRRSRGSGSLVLAAAGLAAATGIALWYLSEHNLLDRLWGGINNRRKSRTKKSVVVIVDNYIANKLPSFQESREYAELYIISGPGCDVPDDVLYSKLEHPTRLLHCETSQGIIHLTKHIKPDVLVTASGDGQPPSDLQGWVGNFILVNRKLAEGSQLGLVQTVWPEGVMFDDLLFCRNEEALS